MTTFRTQVRHVMDWKAAVLAGLIAGAVFLVVLLIAYPLATGGTPWTIFRFIGAMVLGEAVLPPPTSFDAGIVITAVIIHFTLAVLYTLVLAFIVHRWRLLVSVIGGALFGLALYLINFFTFTFFFAWFYPARAWPFSLVHILFGAVAGGIYELLEKDVFIIEAE
ncbi:MAG: hypothetical protein H6652_15250 [Ardenticatenaceae bacterium]|nr:hypothetical protein [Ardenticatenaceae bacterium]MCB8946920.1 hypothetical protein [Ardenticatenaceae bacterium]